MSSQFSPVPVYFGGSRHLAQSPAVAQVVRSVIRSGCSVHVGCQFGADALVIQSALCTPSFLVVFAVAVSVASAPPHVQRAAAAGASVVLSAGGVSSPFPSRYLLRSLAAMRGCGQAVFFQPGPGSLAVASHAVKSGLPVFAFSPVTPAGIPHQAGAWCLVPPESYYFAFSVPCFAWLPATTQASLF